MKAVFVEWMDAESIDAWTSLSEVDHTLAAVHTIGYLIAETEDSITVASNLDTKNESASCIMKIPMGMIIDIRELQVPTKPQKGAVNDMGKGASTSSKRK